MSRPDAIPDRHDRMADLIAGVSVAGLLVPEAMAYAGIAGLPPQAGIVALLVGLLVYAALGRSPVAIVSATSSSAAVLGAATHALAGGDPAQRAVLAAALVLVTGAMLWLAALARLGAASSFISRPVLHGFAFGMALTICIRQVAKIAGLPGCDPEPLRCAWAIARHQADWNLPALAVGIGALILIAALSRWRRLPVALLVLAAMTALSLAADLQGHGVPLVGAVDLHWPVPQWPSLDVPAWLRVGELGLPLAVMLFAESWGAIRSQGARPPSATRELVALGAANLLSAVLQGTPVGAGFSATSANAAAGAATRRAGLVAAAASALVIAGTLGFVAHAPEAALSAIVIAAVAHSLEPARLRQYFRWRRDRIVLLTAIGGVLTLGIVYGLIVGVAASMMMMLRDLASPRVSELGRVGDGHDFLALDHHPLVAPVPGVLVLRPDAPLFFGNVDRMIGEIRRRATQHGATAVVVSLEETPDLDATTLQVLAEGCAALQAQGCDVALARLKDPVLALCEASGLASLRGCLLDPGSVDRAVADLRARAAGTRPGT